MSNATSYGVFKARHVMGSLFDIRTTDHENKPMEENKHHWFAAFAVPKGPEWDAIWATMFNAAATDPACGQALCNQAGFNWKIEDADAPANPQNLGKASYPAGHWIIKFQRYKAMGPIPMFDGSHNPILPTSGTKRGDYWYIDASTVFNGKATVASNAGMYQNLNGLMFAAAGEEIISEGAFNAQAAFAGFQGAAVPGGQAPQGAAPSAPVGQVPTQPVANPQAPVAAPQAAPQAPGAPVQPATDLVQPGNVGAAPAPAPAPQAAEPRYEVNGHVYNKSELVAAGYTDAHFATMQPVQ